MPVVRKVRDLFVGGVDTNPTLQDLAASKVIEREMFPPENPLMTARLPGDADDHPMLEAQRNNPFYGTSPLKVSRLLRAGKIPANLQRQAQSWIDQFQKLEGQAVYNGSNQEFVEPEVTGTSGLRRADPWPFK